MSRDCIGLTSSLHKSSSSRLGAKRKWPPNILRPSKLISIPHWFGFPGIFLRCADVIETFNRHFFYGTLPYATGKRAIASSCNTAKAVCFPRIRPNYVRSPGQLKCANLVRRRLIKETKEKRVENIKLCKGKVGEMFSWQEEKPRVDSFSRKRPRLPLFRADAERSSCLSLRCRSVVGCGAVAPNVNEVFLRGAKWRQGEKEEK